MACAWRNFKIIFSRPLFIIIFRPKILFFVTYSILTGQTKVEFVIYWVLMTYICIFHGSYCCGVNISIGQFMEMIIANLSNSLTDLFSVGRAATTKIYENCNCFMHFLHLNFAPLWCIDPEFSLQFLDF